MIKNIIIGMSMVLFAAGFAGCADWVNVTPKDQVESDKLFNSELGYKSALIGIYARMTLDETYGKSMTYGSVEFLVQRYDNYGSNIPTEEQRAQRYDYKKNESAKNMVNGLWVNLFCTIGNINNLLQNLENGGRNIVTTDGYWTLMKGEALGLRAFHYFDLLRLYGPIYSEDPEMACLPWRTEFNDEAKSLLPASRIAQNILHDLEEAEELLKDDNLYYQNNLDDVFLGYRKHRMNKMAVKALMARVYLWIGDKANAALKAKEVIDGCGFTLAMDNTKDVSLYEETIFGLGRDDMETKVKNDWAELTRYANELYISNENCEQVFNKQNIGINDIRYKNGYGFIHGENGRMCRKYLGREVEYKEKIPLIRLSEMYYILAESVSLEESVTYINLVRNARGISRSNNLVANDAYDEQARRDALNEEYQKEFFAEGQWFYFLKRNNYRTFWRCPTTIPSMTKYYVLPTPDDEIEYGVGAQE